jgi:predicted transcriptional regulator
MRATTHRNLHVPLPAPLHERLQAEATRSKRPATRLAREAIEAWVEEREREAVHEAIATYANEMAGTPADLDSRWSTEASWCPGAGRQIGPTRRG